MSGRFYENKSLHGTDYSAMSSEDLYRLFRDTLNAGTHGLCFSAYEEGQEPGDVLTEQQVRRRMEILKSHTKWIRSFSCIEGNEIIPRIAKELGLKTMVGAWLGDDPELNEKEIQALINMSNEGLVDIAAVGNEVLYRDDMPKSELMDFMRRVKKEIPSSVQMGYVDAYYEFTVHPDLTDLCDVLLANCYPYWEGCPIEHSLVYMKQMYYQARDAAKGKPVIISETGWPSQGGSLKGAFASSENFIKYFVNAQEWSHQADIPMFYFSSFDESWKVHHEGDVGERWGVWDKKEKLKYQ